MVTTAEPQLAVVVCTYNRARQLHLVLDMLNQQTIREQLEVVVVDDGSTSPIEEWEVTIRGATLIRHRDNLGPAAARNTGIAASRAAIVAFTDDDCRPPPGWAEAILSGYVDPRVAAAGGPVVGTDASRLLARYYLQNPPVGPLEAELGESHSVAYRLWLYCRSNISPPIYAGERNVYSLASANISFRRHILEALGGFDASISFGGEDEDICYRLRRAFPEQVLRLVPEATLEHEYDPHLRDALRRASAYGNGNARNFRRHNEWGPTIYPIPLIYLAALAAGIGNRRWLFLANLLPLLLVPRWLVKALRSKSPEPLAYAYVQVLQELFTNVGFVGGYLSARSSSRPPVDCTWSDLAPLPESIGVMQP
jgi:glycosyltransferase involved in cell wall biosynthesis